MSGLKTWRLIQSPALSGAENMALDESILDAVSSADAPPTLRLYAWSPPCLSLGYAQPYADVDIERLATRGWTIVRRPTGGRAILHTDELTYSVIAPVELPELAGGVMQSYRQLSRALVSGLEYLGLTVSVAPEVQLSKMERGNPVCFEVPSSYEIEVDGRKLLGSAQVRRVKGVLQHGTLPLEGDVTRIVEVLNFKDEDSRQRARQRVKARAASLSELTSSRVTWEQAAGALRKGFEHALGWKFDEQLPSPAELDRASELIFNRYSNPDWTARI